MIHLSSDLSSDAYHARPGVTFHRLREFVALGPSWYNARFVTREMPPPPEKQWGAIGEAYHIFGLEGEQAFRARVVAMPATYRTPEPVLVPWNGRLKVCKEWLAANAGCPAPASILDGPPSEEKPWNLSANACKEWCAAHGDKVILTANDYTAAECIGRNMRANPHAARILQCGWPEITIEQHEPRLPVPVMGRIDWLASTSAKLADAFAIADPKGTVELEHFEREAFRLGYFRQMAWYRKLVRDEIGKQLPAFLCAVEKDGMHRCRVFQVEEDLLDRAEAMNNRDLERLMACYESGRWPLDHEDHLRVLTTPAWMKQTDTITNDGPAPWEN